MANEILAQVEAITGTDVLTPATHDFFKTMQRKAPKDVLQRQTGMKFGAHTKYLVYNVPVSGAFKEELELLQITDVQFGSRGCKVKRMLEYRDWVLSKSNRFMFWCGDNVDAWAMWSPGTAWDQMFDPQHQVMRFVEAWLPARHRILGYVGGNHERRAIPGFGDLGILIASLLGIPYSNGRQLIDIYYGDHNPFKTELWHGMGGARTKGTIAQKLDRMMQNGDSQLYLMGHHHQAMVIPTYKEIRHNRANKVMLQKSMGAVGTSFLETWNTYGEVAGYSGSDVLMARAILEPNGKWGLSLK